MAAQSHVAVSLEAPEYTPDVDALGALRILEAMRFLGREKSTFLSGIYFGTIWRGARNASDRDHTVSAEKSLRSCQNIRLLDNG